MIRVLVAEDELPLLRGISKMIENLGPGFRVVKMARTGREALDFLKSEPVDVVFTDINMPVVDGIQVMQYLYEHKPDIMCVVISGYEDFSYAQKAVQYGVKNYLTKPVNKKELSALLEDLSDRFFTVKTEQKRQLLEQMYFGNFSEAPQQAVFHRLYPLYFIIKACSQRILNDDVVDLNVWRDCHPIDVIRALDPGVEGVYPYYGRNPNELLVVVETEHKPDADRIAREMQKRGGLSLPIAAAVGEELSDFKRLREDIGKVRRMISENWVYGKNGLVEEDTDAEPFALSETTEEALQYVIRNQQFKEFRQMLLDIREAMRTRQVTQYQLEQTLNKILMYIWAYQTIFTDENPDSILYDINDMVVQADDLDAVFEDFLQLCHGLMFAENVEDTNALMLKLDNYMQTHYKEPLNTKMLAAKFGLVPSYLSKLFQNYKGITPNHYIQKIRLEKAKDLLIRRPEMMTKDIAFMIGYTDPSYFSKVFKKNTGSYPSEYRTAHLAS